MDMIWLLLRVKHLVYAPRYLRMQTLLVSVFGFYFVLMTGIIKNKEGKERKEKRGKEKKKRKEEERETKRRGYLNIK